MPTTTSERILGILLKRIQDTGKLPWERAWNQKPLCNARTRRAYSGVNILLLSPVADKYNCPYFDTFNGIGAQGGYVKKDEKGTLILAMKTYTKEVEENGVIRLVTRTFFGGHFVWNMGQTSLADKFDGIGFNEPVETDSMVAQYQSAHDGHPVIEHSLVKYPCYDPAEDKIKMPYMSSYKDPVFFEKSRAHELIHSTGHPTRLDRDLTNMDIKNRSLEELTAEIGGLMLLGECGVDVTKCYNHSAAYVEEWHKFLSRNEKALFTAVSQAQKSVMYILGRTLPSSDDVPSSEEKEEDRLTVQSAR